MAFRVFFVLGVESWLITLPRNVMGPVMDIANDALAPWSMGGRGAGSGGVMAVG